MTTRHRGPVACPSRKGRTLALALWTGSLVTGLCPFAHADDLPGLLLSAARLIPATVEGRTKCAVLSPVPDTSSAGAVAPSESSLADADEYTASTRGVYLGETAPGKQPPPFAEALLEAGVAKRYRLSVPQRVHVINPVRGAGLPLFVWQVQTRVTDVIVVTGPDAELFPKMNAMLLLSRPPAVNGGVDAQGEPLGSAAVTPPGIWASNRICLTGNPVRVLEYGDIDTRENGLRFVSAAILFRAERAPPWLSDSRVLTALLYPPLVQDVRFVGFRDDGDGWRPTLVPEAFFLEKKTHLVER